MDPGVVAARDGNQALEGIEDAGVQLAGLQHHNGGGAGSGGKRLFERGGGKAAIVICVEADEVVGAEPEQAHGAFDAAMTITAGEDADPWRACKAAVFDIPSGAFEHGVTRGGEAGDVGHLASGDEGEAGAFRDAEQFL